MDIPSDTPQDSELFLSIRFSASLPDVLLEVDSPKTTTTAGLKRLIRTRLPPELSNHRLRLIYAGKALEDTIPLATFLKLSSRSPPRRDGSFQSAYAPRLSESPSIEDGNEDESDNKDKKGKNPIRNEPQPRIYIHCSIGDVELSASDLAAEASMASTTTATKSVSRNATSSLSFSEATATYHDHNQQHGDQPSDNPTFTSGVSTTTPAPRGFDRLLSAGLSEAEVAALRAQFRAVHSQAYTPDTMPSNAEMQALEERWLENTDGRDASAGNGAAGGAGGGGDDNGSGSPLDDMLWGSVMGFFWPVGCAAWLLREDGVWSWRKGLAVFMGVVINLILGTARMVG